MVVFEAHVTCFILYFVLFGSKKNCSDTCVIPLDMFVLVTLKETVKIPPHKLHLSLNDCIRDELNDQLANKVIVNVGLCITLYDITHVGQSFLHQGDASSHTDGKCLDLMFHALIVSLTR